MQSKPFKELIVQKDSVICAKYFQKNSKKLKPEVNWDQNTPQMSGKASLRAASLSHRSLQDQQSARLSHFEKNNEMK